MLRFFRKGMKRFLVCTKRCRSTPLIKYTKKKLRTKRRFFAFHSTERLSSFFLFLSSWIFIFHFWLLFSRFKPDKHFLFRIYCFVREKRTRRKFPVIIFFEHAKEILWCSAASCYHFNSDDFFPLGVPSHFPFCVVAAFFILSFGFATHFSSSAVIRCLLCR